MWGKQGGRDGDVTGRGIEEEEEQTELFFLWPNSSFFSAVFVIELLL